MKRITKGKKMVINRIYNDRDDYEVGKEDVSKIELTDQGNEKITMYKVTYEDESFLFVGLLEHSIEEQTTIFDYL